MYLLLFFLLVASGAALARIGYLKRRPLWLWGGVALAVVGALLFAVLGFWAEAIWFHAVGFGERFWTFVGARALSAAAGALAAAGVLALLLHPARRLQPTLSPWAELAAGVGGLIWGLGAWRPMLLFFNRAPAGSAEPLLGLDAGFYLFTLPLLQTVHGLMQWVAVVLAAATVIALLLQIQGGTRETPPKGDVILPLAVLSAALGVLVGAGALLGMFGLLYSELGVTAGPGWTDANIRLPAYAALALLSVVLGGAPPIAPVRPALAGRLGTLGE
ncbi:MAG: UPF0182 family protein, partial [Thiohalocapsa sp.]|nr:UPF0182 family protein [Thiohalocapsa sp.]